MAIEKLFPSPYGDFVFQHIAYKKALYHSGYSFRPLTGILFFNRVTLPEYFERVGLLVSVPLRGFCFSTRLTSLSSLRTISSRFRPLTGILFFNLTNLSRQRGSTRACFRPLTGILFFNSPSEKPCHS